MGGRYRNWRQFPPRTLKIPDFKTNAGVVQHPGDGGRLEILATGLDLRPRPCVIQEGFPNFSRSRTTWASHVVNTNHPFSRTTKLIESQFIQRSNAQSIKITVKKHNLIRFLFTFHQLVYECRIFASCASKVIFLRYNRNSTLEKILFIKKQGLKRKQESFESTFL